MREDGTIKRGVVVCRQDGGWATGHSCVNMAIIRGRFNYRERTIFIHGYPGNLIHRGFRLAFRIASAPHWRSWTALTLTAELMTAPYWRIRRPIQFYTKAHTVSFNCTHKKQTSFYEEPNNAVNILLLKLMDSGIALSSVQAQPCLKSLSALPWNLYQYHGPAHYSIRVGGRPRETECSVFIFSGRSSRTHSAQQYRVNRRPIFLIRHKILGRRRFTAGTILAGMDSDRVSIFNFLNNRTGY